MGDDLHTSDRLLFELRMVFYDGRRTMRDVTCLYSPVMMHPDSSIISRFRPSVIANCWNRIPRSNAEMLQKEETRCFDLCWSWF